MPSRRAGFWIVWWDSNCRRFCGKKIKPSLSAGRVQSVAVRLIVEREREIMDFKAAAYYRVLADFTVTDADGKKSAFRAELSKRYATEQEALALLEKCKTAVFTVRNVERKPSKKISGRAVHHVHVAAGSRAQTRYVGEPDDVGGAAVVRGGYITYMRTDSVNLSGQAIAAAKAEIVKLFGEKIFGSPQL